MSKLDTFVLKLCILATLIGGLFFWSIWIVTLLLVVMLAFANSRVRHRELVKELQQLRAAKQ